MGFFGVALGGVGTTGNLLQNNRIGTNAAGTASIGTGIVNGILISGCAGNLIGGPNANQGNVISGGVNGAVRLVAAGVGNIVQNNFIGTNATGTAALAGQNSGVSVDFSSNGTKILNNLVSGNASFGIGTSRSTNTLIAGNRVGTDLSGTVAIPNGTGVAIDDSGNIIGGTTAAARNVISGNTTDGILLDSGATNLVEGNYIGTAANGVSALGNGKRGVFLNGGANNNTVGGIVPGTGNVIAFNGDDGVLIGGNVGDTGAALAGPSNAVLGNSIFSNGKIGIDLGPDDGVTPNNSGFLNYPTLTIAAAAGNSIVIVGNISLSGTQGGAYRLEFFASPKRQFQRAR